MKNPIIATPHDNFVTLSQHAQHFTMRITTDGNTFKNLVCSFLENGKNLYAAVIAPIEDIQWLARRVVSFIGAHLRIHNKEDLEREIQHSIERYLHSNPH